MILIPRLLSAQSAHQQEDGGSHHEEGGGFAEGIKVIAQLLVPPGRLLSYHLI
jgi:hypothetical protein